MEPGDKDIASHSYWLRKFFLIPERLMASITPGPLTPVRVNCRGLQGFIQAEINLFKDPAFAGFQHTLESEMKQLRSLDLGLKTESR